MSGHVRQLRIHLPWVLAAVVTGSVLGYTLAVDPVVHSASQVLYPAVWLATSLSALWVIRDRVVELRPLPLAVGTGYTFALLWTAGLLGSPSGPGGVTVHFAMPGWGPAVVYTGQVLTVVVVPFLAAGYATLGLLAASAIQVSLKTTAAGALGLFACVGCTAPLLAGLAGSLGAGSVATTVSGAQFPLATAAFLVSTLGLLALARRGDASDGR